MFDPSASPYEKTSDKLKLLAKFDWAYFLLTD